MNRATNATNATNATVKQCKNSQFQKQCSLEALWNSKSIHCFRLQKLHSSPKYHPSIHFLYPLNLSVGSRGAGAYPSGHWARGGVHAGQVASPSQGHTEKQDKQPCTLTVTPRMCFFTVGRSQRASIWDSNRKPFCCEVMVLTTPPCCPTLLSK